jgi:short-subunit dehydrogenase
VVIAARTLKELERVKSECKDPSRVKVMELDLSKPEEVLQRAKDQKLIDRIDILINNGGLSMREEFKNVEFKVCQYMMNTNCLSHIALVHAFLPKMIAQNSGHIVNVLTIGALIGVPVRTMYCSSKFAMDGFGKSLREEVRRHGIQVTQVYPGYIRTNISKNAATGSG